jgi:hypothetical protein
MVAIGMTILFVRFNVHIESNIDDVSQKRKTNTASILLQ